LIFLDEFGINLAMTRTYARSPIGQRAVVSEPFNPGAKLSVISALRLGGVEAPMMIEGGFNSEIFNFYVEQMLLPCLRAGRIIVFDNVKFHYWPRAIALIEAAGAKDLNLPAYSPDFNPLEECISKIKEALRSFKARTQRKWYNAQAKAIGLVTENDILGWFKHCGYVFSIK
jgi:transposase